MSSTLLRALALFTLGGGAALAAPLAHAADQPVSYYKDIFPILKKNCIGCHHADKAKGKLDLTTFSAFKKGGKKDAGFMPGDPGKSLVLKMISGKAPEMPEEGDPLKAEQVALIERWIKEGAADDSPAPLGPKVPAVSPVYRTAPAVTDAKYSPDGSLLAITGYHEVLLYKADGSELIGRLLGGSPRIESIAFSDDGKFLAVAGGSPAQWGEIQVWNVAEKKQVKSFRVGNDSLFGVSFSPDHALVAFGSSDKTARVFKVEDGSEVLLFGNHSDWVFGTCWTVDGKKIVTGSRDMAMKLSEIETKRFIDDINNPLDTVDDMARHPKQDMIVYGGKAGTVRIYKISDNQGRTAARTDTNLIRLFERQPGPVTAVAYSPEGDTIAVGSTGSEVRLYKTADGVRAASLPGHTGAVYAVAYRPDGKAIVTAGFDGVVRIFELPSGNLLKTFPAGPVSDAKTAAK